MNTKELFEICLDGWRQYDELYRKDFDQGIITYTFTNEITLFTTSLRLVKNINSESLSSLKYNFRGKDIYFHALRENRGEVAKQIKNTKYILRSTIGHNVWTKLLKLDRRDDIEVLSGRIDSDLYEEYKNITKELFQVSEDTIPELNKKILTEIPTNHEVLILKKDGVPVGTACYLVHKETCWMFGGSVFPEFRDQGFWKYMVYIRQNLSQKYGAKYWFIQTEVDLIRGKSDFYFELDCYQFVSEEKD